MNIAFRTERFDDVWHDARPLLRRHWEELACKDICGPLDMDTEVYRRLEQAGALHVTTARLRESGVGQAGLVGYAVYVLAQNMHYRGLLAAEPDVFFLLPEHRRGMTGVRLLRAAEAALARRGAGIVMQKVKISRDCGVIFKRMGYTHVENLWMKRLG